MARRMTLMLTCVVVTFALASCSNYTRNYSGPVAPKEKVAFVFNDDASLRGKIIAENVEGAVEGEITLGSKPYCHELLPGSYSVEARVTRRTSSSAKPPHSSKRTYGEIDAKLMVKPNHIYSLKSTKHFGSEKKIWFLTFHGDKYWELDVHDVTHVPKYQKLVAKLDRETE